MSTFKQQSVAAVMAVLISVISLQTIVTVPPAQAQTSTSQIVELA
ncbi:hypothetical protein ACRAQ6_05545 [Erythrobacter sp. HA6-11]